MLTQDPKKRITSGQVLGIYCLILEAIFKVSRECLLKNINCKCGVCLLAFQYAHMIGPLPLTEDSPQLALHWIVLILPMSNMDCCSM